MCSVTSTRHIIQEITELLPEQIEADLRATKHEEANVQEQIDRLTDDLDRLRLEADLLAQALRLRQSDEATPKGTKTSAGNSATALTPVSRLKRGSISKGILAVVRDARGAAVSPQDVGEALERTGIAADQNAVRVALRRWADRGAIVKEGRLYRSSENEPLSVVDPPESSRVSLEGRRT